MIPPSTPFEPQAAAIVATAMIAPYLVMLLVSAVLSRYKQEENDNDN